MTEKGTCTIKYHPKCCKMTLKKIFCIEFFLNFALVSFTVQKRPTRWVRTCFCHFDRRKDLWGDDAKCLLTLLAWTQFSNALGMHCIYGLL